MDKEHNLQNKIFDALRIAEVYGHIDGERQKAWVIDQMVRVLSDDYIEWINIACDGKELGPNAYPWDVGIAP